MTDSLAERLAWWATHAPHMTQTSYDADGVSLAATLDEAVEALREAEEREKIARVWEWEEAQLVTDSFNQCSCGLYEYSKQRLNELRGTDESDDTPQFRAIVEALREIEAATEALSPGCHNQLMEIIAWNREVVGGTDE